MKMLLAVLKQQKASVFWGLLELIPKCSVVQSQYINISQ